jgi:hypothetical protein
MCGRWGGGGLAPMFVLGGNGGIPAPIPKPPYPAGADAGGGVFRLLNVLVNAAIAGFCA